MLVVVQFGLAIAFIIGAVVLVAQTTYMHRSDLGFRRDGLLVVPLLADRRGLPDRARHFLALPRRLPGVVSVGEGGAGSAARLFGVGAGLAVMIACGGLWGLASFSTARRIKEIGIRKTLGASSPTARAC